MRIVIQGGTGSVKRAAFGLGVFAALFIASGTALLLLARSDVPPPLGEVTHEIGTLSDVRMHRNNRGAPYLELTVDGGTYTVASYRRAWLDSVAGVLHAGDRLTVWSRTVPNGSGQIWQLQRGDSMVVPYAERRSRKEGSNRGTTVFGEALILLGCAGAIGAFVASGRGRGTGR